MARPPLPDCKPKLPERFNMMGARAPSSATFATAAGLYGQLQGKMAPEPRPKKHLTSRSRTSDQWNFITIYNPPLYQLSYSEKLRW